VRVTRPRIILCGHAGFRNPTDADATDDQLLTLWLHGRAPLTIRAYRRETTCFRSFIKKPLRLVTLGDM
jgi:hypothetical protein